MATKTFTIILLLFALPSTLPAANIVSRATLVVDIDPCAGTATYTGSHKLIVSNLTIPETNIGIFLSSSIANCNLPWNSLASSYKEGVTGGMGTRTELISETEAVRLCAGGVSAHARSEGGFLAGGLVGTDIDTSGCITVTCSLPHDHLTEGGEGEESSHQ